MTIDEMVISLGLDPSGVKSGMEQAERNVSGGMRKITGVLKSFVAPIAGMFAVGKLFDSYISGAAELDRLSGSLGVDIERLQEWQGAARTAGVEASEIGNLFRDMNDRITDAVQFDSGPLKEIGAQLGLSLTDVNGAARNTEEILLDLSDAFASINEQEATGYGVQLGIDPNMIGLLQQGRGALEDLFRQQRELGVYTKQDAEIATKFTRALGDLWQSVKMGSAIILRIVVPALTTMVGWFSKGVNFLRAHEKFVQIFFIGLATAITAYAIPALAKLAVAAATNPFTWLIAGATALALVLEDLYVWMNGGKAALGDFWSMFGTPDEVKAKVEKFIETLKSIVPIVLDIIKYVKDLIVAWWPLIAVLGTFAAMVKAIAFAEKIFVTIKTAIMGMRAAMLALNVAMAANPIGAVIAAIAAAIAISYVLIKNWDKIKETAAEVWAAVAETIGGAWSRVKEGAAQLWAGIKGIFSGAVDWFSGIFDGIVDAIAAPFAKAFDKIKSGWNAVKGIFGGGKGDSADAGGAMPDASMLLSHDAAQAISPASVSNSTSSYNSDTSVNIGKVEISTQATDAEGISRDIGKGLQKNVAKFTVNQANSGVAQ